MATSTPQVLRWQLGPLRFELSCPAALVPRLSAVFAPWGAGLPLGESAPGVNSMAITPHEEGWLFRGSQHPQPLLCANVAAVCRAAETDAAMAVMNSPDDFISVHGALVSTPQVTDGRAVLIVGPSLAGKSTLACALWSAGWRLLCDDVSLLRPHEPAPHAPAVPAALPLPRRLSVRGTSRPILGEGLWQILVHSPACDILEDGLVCHPPRFPAGQGTAAPAPGAHTPLPIPPVRLGAVLFLARSGASDQAPAAARPIDPVDALVALAPYTNLIRHSTLGETLQRLAPALANVPCYDLSRGEPSAMVSTIRQITAMAAGVNSL